MTSKISDNPRRFLLLIAAATALLAAPGWAQEAEDSTASAPEAAGAPEDAGGEEPKGGDEADGGGQADGGAAATDSAEGEPKPGDAAADGATAGEDAAADADAEKNEDGGPLIVEAEEGSVIDDQTFEGDDDDFTPSEEIPVDQPIPFPIDI